MKKGLEVRRQLDHLMCGTLIICLYIAVLFFLPNLNPLIPALFLAVLGVKFALLAELNLVHKIPGINFLVNFLEREENVKSFPGKGYIMFLFGCAVSIFVFPPLIALSAMAIVTYGDATATLFGRWFGKIKFIGI